MKKLIALALAATFVVAACSSSTDDAVATYCDDLSALKTAIASLDTLSATSTVDDVTSAKDDITSAQEAVVSSASDVEEAVTADIEAAQQTFIDSVKDVEGDSSVSDAIDGIKTAGATYVQSVEAAIAQVSCS